MTVIDVHTHMYTRGWLDLLRTRGGIYGLKTRPDGREEIDPAFEHVAAGDLPVITDGGITARVIMGSPVAGVSADEIIDGRPMSEHLRFSIAYWHAFRGTGSDPFGPGTIVRPWETGRDPLSIAKARMDAAFEFLAKIRAPFYCFHDRDIAPEGRTLRESNRLLDAMVDHARDLQRATGVKLLWGTANLFSNPRYMCGAATNPDAHVFAYAAAQVKKALEVRELLRQGEVLGAACAEDPARSTRGIPYAPGAGGGPIPSGLPRRRRPPGRCRRRWIGWCGRAARSGGRGCDSRPTVPNFPVSTVR